MREFQNIAIIPARGGSKRIPDKNIVDFFGKPLIAYTIEAAKNSCLFDKIIVSTDCEKIKKISENYGAEVPFLRDKYSDDLSSVAQATLRTLTQCNEILEESYTNVVQLMPNCPLRNEKDIIKAYEFYQENNADLLVSCFEYNWMNPWWALKVENNKGQFIFKEELKKRSQDLDKLYCPTGSIWMGKSEILKKTQSFYSDETLFYQLNWKSSIDIDNYDDLEMAKAFYLLKNHN
ncbi:MAG: acylneuraminate cytidylyltransferase family protein [bacterium]